MRDNAIESDKKLLFPRKNFQILAKHGLLGLLVPKELGGMGQNHVCAAMVVETIARYACPSTAMCYTMHTGAVAAALFRHHNNPTIQDIMRRIDKDCLVGTLSYSDPETGSHFWYPISSGAEKVEGGYRCARRRPGPPPAASPTGTSCRPPARISPATSPTSPAGSPSSTRSRPSPRSGTGSACAATSPARSSSTTSSSPPDRMVGPKGDGASSNDECVDPFFLLCSSACWNGISLGLIDIAKRHTTMKKHVDVGMRVADYPTIQDYVGEAIIDTQRSPLLRLPDGARRMDDATNNCDWSIHKDLKALPRAQFLPWMWQVKFAAAKNVAHVTDKMLHACGGTGYKPGLGIERYLRDGKAGWVMGPTNEVLRQFVGKSALLGFAVARLLEPVHQRARPQQRAEEARRRRQKGARREAAEGGSGESRRIAASGRKPNRRTAAPQ